MAKKFEKMEIKLDEELMEQFIGNLERAINSVVSSNLGKDSRPELFTTLLSFAAQVAQDIGIENKSFLKLSKQFFEEAERTVPPIEEMDKSQAN